MIRTSRKRPNQLTVRSRLYQKLIAAPRALGYYPAFGKYNLTVSAEKKFIWFRVAKVGTRSILAHLVEHADPLTAQHPIGIYYNPNHYLDYFKFAFVRNPWNRFVSAWHNRVVVHNQFNYSPLHHREMSDFEAFVGAAESDTSIREDIHFKPQTDLVDLFHIDFVGRFESFERDLHSVFNRLGIPVSGFPHRNKSGPGKKDVFTKELRKRVYAMYLRDFQIFYPGVHSETFEG